jgi:DNA-binding response OmpR family regulator
MADKVLVIDDDLNLLNIMRQILASSGYIVATASNADDGLRLVQEQLPDLVLLDIMMPNITGWEVCARIRQISNVPCIFLTARSDEEDKVKGLELGADDYIVKPFHTAELRARVRAVLRRARPNDSARGPILSYGQGELVINTTARTVAVRGQAIALTPTEYRLLVFLAERPDRVLTAEQIYDAVWSGETGATPSSVKWYIWRLRRKIESVPRQPRFILTESIAGYRFNAD